LFCKASNSRGEQNMKLHCLTAHAAHTRQTAMRHPDVFTQDAMRVMQQTHCCSSGLLPNATAVSCRSTRGGSPGSFLKVSRNLSMSGAHELQVTATNRPHGHRRKAHWWASRQQNRWQDYSEVAFLCCNTSASCMVISIPSLIMMF
jgi:hypothetical protein